MSTNGEGEAAPDMGPPRERQTPITVAAGILGDLEELWDSIHEEKGHFSRFLEPLWDEPDTGDDIWKMLDGEGEHGALIAFVAAFSWCKQALKADPESSIAWTYVADARYAQGILKAHFAYRQHQLPVDLAFETTERAKKAAGARHAENRALKEDALAFYRANQHKFKSNDAAAQEIAGKVVPAKFRTVRDWIAEYRKEQKG